MILGQRTWYYVSMAAYVLSWKSQESYVERIQTQKKCAKKLSLSVPDYTKSLPEVYCER